MNTSELGSSIPAPTDLDLPADIGRPHRDPEDARALAGIIVGALLFILNVGLLVVTLVV